MSHALLSLRNVYVILTFWLNYDNEVTQVMTFSYENIRV